MHKRRRPKHLRFWLWLAVVAIVALAVAWPKGQRADGFEPILGLADTLVPGEIVVDFRDNVDSPSALSLFQSLGLNGLELGSPSVNTGRLFIVKSPLAAFASTLARLRGDSRIEAVEPQRLFHAYGAPNDPRYSEQWNFKRIGMEKAWDVTRGKGVVVAVIDTGVAFEKDSKCYLARDFGETKFTDPYDFVSKDKHPTDDNGHGTHVAGTIAESTNNGEGVAGIAYEATIMPIKVLTREGSGRMSDVAAGIRYAADHGADVINMSLGAPFADSVTRAACKYAYDKGVVIVCAAGNSGREGVGYPAAYPECIAVSAVGPKGDLTPYSSWGKEVSIAAPGGDKSLGEEFGILQNTYVWRGGESQEDGYFGFQGTSMASPHVAGVAALIISTGIHDPAEVKAVLERSASPKGPKAKYGAGELNAAAAVAAGVAGAGGAKGKGWLIFACAGIAALATAMFRRKDSLAPLAAGAAVAVGIILPDIIQGMAGFGSGWNLLGHSAIVPAYLFFCESDSASERKWYGLLALGVGIHLVRDLFTASVPFFSGLDLGAMAWLWANIGVAGLAFLRGVAVRR